MRVVYNDAPDYYNQLFTDAVTLLSKIDDPEIPKPLVIPDLATYYKYLDKLEEYGGPRYLRDLPFYEDIFEIDPDLRTITPKNEHTDKNKTGKVDKTWYIGVKGDHLAELLWFHIPRFIDGQDLAICFPKEKEEKHHGQTYVQWTNGLYKGLDAVQHVLIEDEDIYFAWYLHNVGGQGVLSNSGTLTFSIRFQYQEGTKEDDGQPNLESKDLFSFNTVSYDCKILPNLIEKMGVNHTELKIENLNNVERPRFAGFYDNISGSKPIILEDGDLPDYTDLNEQNQVTLSVKAISNGKGSSLVYEWKKGLQTLPVQLPEPEEGDEVTTYDPEEVRHGDSYTIIFNPEEPDKTVTGEYYVSIGNQDDTGKIRYITSNICEITPPSSVTLTKLPERFAIDGENKVTLVATLNKVGKHDRYVGTLTYLLQHAEDEKAVNDAIAANDQKALDNLFITVSTDTVTTNAEVEPYIKEYSKTYSPENNGMYRVRVYNTHNGTQSTNFDSNIILVRHSPVAVNSVDVSRVDGTNELIVTVDCADTQKSSDLYYLWTKTLHNGGSEALTKGWISEEQGGNKFTVTSPGYYECKVQQIIFNGTPDVKTVQPGDIKLDGYNIESLV